jgi:hypothetical protein
MARGGCPVNRRHPESVPGAVEVRVSGLPQDVGTLVSVLERLAAGLPVTTVGLEVLHKNEPRVNRRDPGERVYLEMRVYSLGGPQS